MFSVAGTAYPEFFRAGAEFPRRASSGRSDNLPHERWQHKAGPIGPLAVSPRSGTKTGPVNRIGVAVRDLAPRCGRRSRLTRGTLLLRGVHWRESAWAYLHGTDNSHCRTLARRQSCTLKHGQTHRLYAEFYSYRRLSTGSSCAARVAGTVPKRTPTTDETTIAIIAESPEIGMRYSVRKRTE